MKLEAKCQKHWDKIGISNLETLQTYIKGIFRKHDHQEKILIDLYKMVLPDWERIKKSGVIPKQAVRYGNLSAICLSSSTKKKHPGCMAGGIWMNNGFQSNSELDPWELSFENYTVEYMAGPACD